MTHHIVDILADTSPIDHLDFNPACDNDWCDNPAMWALWPVACCRGRRIWLPCTGCRDFVWSWPSGQCGTCHTIFTPARAAFSRCEPLRGGT